MPPPNVILRMVAFAVAAGLAMAGVQPIVAAAQGSVRMGWALGLAAPALATAALVFGAARISDRGSGRQPPWYTAWLVLPGSFLLAGAAAMCIFGALVEFALISWTLWALLVSGAGLWGAAMVMVRERSR